MRAASLALVLMVSAMAASGCVGSSKAYSVGAPVWESGYWFEYQSTATVRGFEFGDDASEADVDELGPFTYTLRVLNTTMAYESEPLYVAAFVPGSQGAGQAVDFMGLPDGFGFVGFRQRDLAHLDSVYETSTQCVNQDCVVERSVTFEAPPEATYLDFPLTNKKTWIAHDSSSEGIAPEDDDFPTVVQATTKGKHSLQTPAGTFDVVPVEFRARFEGIEAFKQEVKQDLESEGYDVKQVVLEFNVVQTDYYADDAQAVVRTDGFYRVVVGAKGTDPDGQAFSSGINLQIETREELQAFGLVAEPEVDLGLIEQVEQLLIDDPRAPITPGPDSAEEEPLQLLIGATPHLTIPDEAETPLTALVNGKSPDPLAVHIEWVVDHVDGTRAFSDTGAEVLFRATDPGQYWVTATATSPKGQQVSQQMLLTVDEVDSTTLACGLVSSDTASLPCQDQVPIPVRKGIQSIVVTATFEDGVNALDLRELVLEAPQGSQWSATPGPDGSMQIRVDDPDELEVQDGLDWSVVIESGATLQGAYHVDWQLYTYPDEVTPAPDADGGQGSPNWGPPGWENAAQTVFDVALQAMNSP